MGLLFLLGGMASARGREWSQRLRRPNVCPRCGQQAVVIVDIGKATVPENDEHKPGLCTLHVCKSCGAKLKRQPQSGPWVEPDDDELSRFPTVAEVERMEERSLPTQSTGAGAIAFLGSWLVSVFVAFRIGIYAYLLWWYGPGPIWRERLRIVDTSKGRPWSVSNGEQVPNGEWFAALVGIPLTLVLFFALIALIGRFSPWKLQRPLDDAARETQERGEAVGGRVLVIAGLLILLSSFTLLFILSISRGVD
jgi:hypothetical protein